MSVQQYESVVKRLEDVATRLETLSHQKPALPPKPANASGSSITSSGNGGLPNSIKQYEDQVDEPLNAFLTICKNIGGDVTVAAQKLKSAFDLQKHYIWFAAGQAKPADSVIQAKLKPIWSVAEEISQLKDSKRNTPQFNHLSAIAEGVNAVGWVTMAPTPAPHVKEMLDASMFFVNRVRNENKSNELHTDWAKGWCDVLNALQKYVRQSHTTGITWNSNPGTNPPSTNNVPSVPPPPKGGPPPPPPPPPPSDLLANAGGDDASARQALFADLNKGEAVTSRLKKVTDDMKTHKNPDLRGNVTSAPKADSAKTTAKSVPAAVDKPAKTELQDSKMWSVEYHKDNRNILVEVADMKQTVYIFRCQNSVIQIKGKVNSVTIDGCKKTSVVFDNLLSQVEVINCQSIEVQSLGALPTVSIQKTDGCQIYLSKESLGAEIITSKSSEMNILAPVGDDFIELPVPEQFKTVFNPATKKLTTTVSDIV